MHEVAQVAAAGGVISEDVMNTAVITKMARVILLAPFLLMLTYMLRNQAEGEQKGKITIPWFAIGFVIVIGVHSLPIWREALVNAIIWLDTLMLCMAMGALGLTTHFGDMKQVGVAPFKLAGAIWIWLVLGGALLNGFVNIW